MRQHPLTHLVALAAVLLSLHACNEPTQTNTTTHPTAPAPNNTGALAQQTQEYASQYGEPNANADFDVEWLSPAPGTESSTGSSSAARPPQPRPAVRYEPPVQPKPEPDPEPVAPTPQPATAPKSTESLVTALARSLRQATREADDSLRPWIARAALAVIDPSRELTESEVTGLSTADRRVVMAYQRTFVEMGRALGKDRRADRQLLENLADQLSEQVAVGRSLRIVNLKLCKRVNGYGVYETFGRNVFLAGRTQPMIVYAELDNFQTRRKGDGMNHARLTQEIVLYNQTDGLPVWKQRPVEITDESLNHRQDFFVVQVIKLSDRLTVGKYLLKVTITDEIGQTMDEATAAIEIVADPQLLLESKDKR